jgi:hypothetical protein
MLPKDEPLFRRFDFRRDTPRRQIVATVRRIPASNPGKKPTITAVVGNFSQDFAENGLVSLVLVTGITEADWVLLGVWVEEAVGEDEEDLEDEGAGGGEASWLAFMTHFPFVLQL